MYSYLHGFYIMSFFCSRYHIHDTTFTCHASNSWLWQFLRLYLLLVTWIVLMSRVIFRCTVGCPSIEICLSFSHDQTGVMSLGEEDHRSEVPFSLYYIKVTQYQHDLTLDIDLDHLDKVVFDRSLHCPLSILYLMCFVNYL